MRKMLSAALLMCIVALLSTLSISAVHATPPITALGTWTYIPTIIDTREADDYTFFYGEEDSTWTGTFEGTSYDVFCVETYPSGIWYVVGLSFFEGTVNGEEGTLVIRFVGKKTVEPPLWSGEWVILSGTDELANLRGQGTWWGPGAPGPGEEGDLEYSGWIHFWPD